MNIFYLPVGMKNMVHQTKETKGGSRYQICHKKHYITLTKKLKIPNNSIRHIFQFTTNEINISPTTPANLRHNSMQLQSLYTAI